MVILNLFTGFSCLYNVRFFAQYGKLVIEIEDFILIHKIQSGDTDAFDTLVRKHYQSIYQFCFRRFNGDSNIAADLTQDVFLKLLENVNKYKPLGKFQNFLFTIAVNTCNNYYKKIKPEVIDAQELSIISHSPTPLENLIEKEKSMWIQSAINHLPKYQRDTIILRFYYDMKIKDIAIITDVSIPTTKSRLRQGLDKLKKYLSDREAY